MVQRAVAEGTSDRLDFSVGDLRDWRPDEPVDVLVSNATLQWVPDHLALLPRPGRARCGRADGSPSRSRATSATAATPRWPRWRPRRGGASGSTAATGPGRRSSSRRPTSSGWPVWAARWTRGRRRTSTCSRAPDAVVRWVSGTGLRPYLQVLADDEEREAFLGRLPRAGRDGVPENAVGDGAAVPAHLRRRAAGGAVVTGLVGPAPRAAGGPGRVRGGAARGSTASVLGMTEVPKPPALAARGGAWFRAGALELHLGVEDDFRPARKAHPGLLVDDLPAFAERLGGARGRRRRGTTRSRASAAATSPTRTATGSSSWSRSAA